MSKKTFIILAIIVIGLLGGMNMLLMMSSPKERSVAVVQEQEPMPSEQLKTARRARFSGKLTRSMQMDPGREFFMNVVFADGKEVARFKSDEEVIFDVEGDIPDGTIEFSNMTSGAYGVENFDGGKRTGLYKEYFASGQLRFEKIYSYGKLLSLKEFYVSGDVRMTVDYSDALLLTDDDETGSGKIFFNDGVLMYEWHLTTRDPNRYKKMYNYRGDLVEIHHFDAAGKLADIK